MVATLEADVLVVTWIGLLTVLIVGLVRRQRARDRSRLDRLADHVGRTVTLGIARYERMRIVVPFVVQIAEVDVERRWVWFHRVDAGDGDPMIYGGLLDPQRLEADGVAASWIYSLEEPEGQQWRW